MTNLRSGDDGLEQFAQLLLLLLLGIARLLRLTLTLHKQSHFSSAQLLRLVILIIIREAQSAPFRYTPSSRSARIPAPSYL